MLTKLFKMYQKADKSGNIILGFDVKTKKPVAMSLADRMMNTMIISPIGTGNTTAIVLPTINQDLHHMVLYINSFRDFLKSKTEIVGERYMSGISVIDPSNDLCQKTLELVKAHGIPEEVITYINPLDPNTASINPMNGPVQEVADTMADVILEINSQKEVLSTYEQELRRNHVKLYIYLLKLHDPNIDVTLELLVNMYNNPQLVEDMLEQLRGLLPLDIEVSEEQVDRDYWFNALHISDWFTVKLKNDRVGSDKDANAIRSILMELWENPLIHEVLFGASNFDFERHMQSGGVLLVNTAKGDLGPLSSVIGKLILKKLQHATFRRQPHEISSYHHILVNEAPDYLYREFPELTAQTRKYKMIVTTLHQTIEQLVEQFGESYLTTLIGTMRNFMVYGHVSTYEAKYFSSFWGEAEVFANPFLEPFISTAKLVNGNRPMPAQQIKHSFIPIEEFIQSKYVVNKESGAFWLQERMNFEKRNNKF
ncbi:type IV secretory system conjugative DNA transfer family protein [Sporosarcina sp. FSL K6-1508]|uniref:type IV secretory system conjugative DNA transfer family protein n=1 Tax=Sporosarcina sp. FSL K6-1508 TaxID=2921553 RepID=UPI0030F7A2FF